MTPRAKIIYDMISHAAELGLRCPTNQQFSAALGSNSKGVGQRLFSELVAEGHIYSYPASSERVVTIMATGEKTAVPSPKPKPKIYNALVAGGDKTRQKADNPHTMTGEERMALVKGGPRIVTDRVEIDIVGAPSTCQYPFGHGPFTFCGKETVSQRSYCPKHLALCYRPDPRKAHV